MPLHLTILGAGPGGYVAAIRAAQRGARVTVVEAAEVGGTCLNRGCIPTKTVTASVHALDLARNAADFGIEITGTIGFNLAKIRERKDRVVSTQVKGIRSLFKSWGVQLLEGRGSLVSNDTVRIVQKDGTVLDLKSDAVIIATGSRPALIPGFPFDRRTVITSDDAIQLNTIPKSILIVGAGVIGSEFAFIYRALGSEVTMVEMMPHALSTEDEEISGITEREMKKSKIKLYTNVKVDGVETGSGGMVTKLSNGQVVTAEQILVSIGRSLNSENIGLEDVGVNKGKRGEIIVNEKMETSVPGVYAIGDVTGKILLAHVASHQGLVAVENALGGDSRMDYSAVPSAIFTMPEIGSVGIREKEAVERGIRHRTGRFQFRALGKAHAMGEITGMVKILADEQTDKVIGVHICGAHATDLVHEGVLAIKMGATAEDLSGMIHAHPTLSEAIMESAEDVHKTAIHIPKTGK
jgi:dihydrolipoamide dehydrogenase